MAGLGGREAMSDLIKEVGSHRSILEKLLAETKGIVRVASAYVTDKDLLLSSNGKEIRLLFSLSKMDIVIGATSLECLQLLVQNGVKCRFLDAPPKFHAKVYIFDEEFAVVTSANLTQSALDKNIEVGVNLRRSAVSELISWFDDHWTSEGSEPLTLQMISSLRDETATLRAKFKKLRRLAPPESRQGISQKGGPQIKIPFPTAYFLCNTDRRHNHEAEKLMRETEFAAAWEPFDYTEHVKKVKRDDLILMYANRVGIIAVGRAEGEYKILSPAEPDRIKQGDTPEWRIPVKWLRWVHSKDACPWKPHSYKTFVDVSFDSYAARRKRVLTHFKVVLKDTV